LEASESEIDTRGGRDPRDDCDSGVLGIGGVSVNGDDVVREAGSVGRSGDGSRVSGDRGCDTVTRDLV
jgi:hypothetical protein